MKKTLVLGLAIGLVSAASMVFAGASENLGVPTQGGFSNQKNFGGAGIVGSSHDMSNVGGGANGAGSVTGYNAINSGSAKTGGITGNTDAQKRICVYCHHPHNAHAATGNTGGRSGKAAAIGSYSPLWNRTTTGVGAYLAADGGGTVAFTGYNNGIMMGGVNASDTQHSLNAASRGGNGNTGTAISGVSLLCMSCHDGVTAMNAYSQGTGSSDNQGDNLATTALGSRTSAFKGNMNNHHPMGFQYKQVALADNEIADADTTIMVPSDADITSHNTGALTGTVTIASLLYGADETMECVTCHDVHNTANATGAERFLWRSDNNSNFCLTCHLK
jgi:hypothetical protein